MDYYFKKDSRLSTDRQKIISRIVPSKGFLKKWALMTFVLGTAAALVFTLMSAGPSASALISSGVEALRLSRDMPLRPVNTKEAIVGRRDTFFGVLTGLGISDAEARAVIARFGEHYDLRKLKEGDTLKAEFLDAEFKSVEYYYDSLHGVRVEKGEAGYGARMLELESSVITEIKGGVISSSLYESALGAGVNPKIIMELSDIFAWDVDFSTDIRTGDSFSVVYENVYAREPGTEEFTRYVSTGRVMAAEIVNDGKKFSAFYFVDSTGKGGYYDADGTSVARALLKSPLRYRRVSSYFSRNRYHPILKRFRPHHGIDYAAPTGTPVESAGAGRVEYAGWKGGYGNVVVVKHNAAYSTSYGHLSRISGDVRKGRRIEQGDVVGYVGSTGISTGPHLHYEIRINGALVNPLGIKSPPAKKLKDSDLAAFNAAKTGLVAKLSTKTVTEVASIRPSGETLAQ
ncbi:MAG: peptidoglycan DD-metalloendopeptidase family protein [Deltaproteobacteria bacterium]|nr:peptidoglycan DD-metalloendopeptidase family protein [Deltaproteobacteria bacterium]